MNLETPLTMHSTKRVHDSLFTPSEICEGVQHFRLPTLIVHDTKRNRIGIQIQDSVNSDYTVLGTLPALYPEWLGDRSFLETHSVRFPYICGEMANGIASVKMVISAAKSGLLAFFGAAGLSLKRIESEIETLQSNLDQRYTWGTNLIHSPNEPTLEKECVEFYLKKNITRISASAFMGINTNLVHYACKGLYEKEGRVFRKNYLFAKISRPETAKQFMSPAPKTLLEQLLCEGKLTDHELKLASQIPLSEDITVEADSAGHTDNQVLPSILSTILELRNKLQKEFAYRSPIRVGAAGGIGSPNGAAAAFSMGAAYILTGSINQCCIEADLDLSAKKMLEAVRFGDTMMCAASDMFEQGVKLQVLKRGSMYAVRANWLYELYKTYASVESLPSKIIERLEKEIFQLPLNEVWKQTKAFWLQRDPIQIEKAEHDPKHLMALLFRYYLGLSSKWAIQGQTQRQFDYQIWCGPAQAAFNHWVQNTFLATQENRTVSQVAFNILEGAAQIQRAFQLRSFGVPVPSEAFEYKARKLSYDAFTNESLHVH